MTGQVECKRMGKWGAIFAIAKKRVEHHQISHHIDAIQDGKNNAGHRLDNGQNNEKTRKMLASKICLKSVACVQLTVRVIQI